MFLSIIIPVYNAEKTIERCLDSIWSQELPHDDYEVICVDDGSNDNSVELLKSMAINHNQLRLVQNRENIRAGGARNHGVRQARGEYIVFIDADDYFYHDALKNAFDYQKETRLDILMMDTSRQYSTSDKPKLSLNFPNKSVMDGESFISENTCPFGPTKYIFRKHLMTEYSIWFEEGCCCEDVDWCVKMTLSARTIQYLPKILQVIIINESSTTAIEHLNFKSVSDKIFASIRLNEIANNPSISDKVKDYINKISLLYAFEGLKYMNSCREKHSIKEKWIRRIANCYTPPYSQYNIIVNLALSHPILYSYLSNIFSLVVPYFIYVKRLIKRR